MRYSLGRVLHVICPCICILKNIYIMTSNSSFFFLSCVWLVLENLFFFFNKCLFDQITMFSAVNKSTIMIVCSIIFKACIFHIHDIFVYTQDDILNRMLHVTAFAISGYASTTSKSHFCFKKYK